MAEPATKEKKEKDDQHIRELNEKYVESLMERFGKCPNMSLAELEADMKEYAPELYQLEFCNDD